MCVVENAQMSPDTLVGAGQLSTTAWVAAYKTVPQDRAVNPDRAKDEPAHAPLIEADSLVPQPVVFHHPHLLNQRVVTLPERGRPQYGTTAHRL